LFAVCSPVGCRTVALFRRLFHQSVTELLSCSLSLTASSQLKPFVFCYAIQLLRLVHPVVPGGNPCLFFSFKRTSLQTVSPSLLLSFLQMPGTHSTGQLLLWLVYRQGLRLLPLLANTRSIRVDHSLVALVTAVPILPRSSLQPDRSSLLGNSYRSCRHRLLR